MYTQPRKILTKLILWIILGYLSFWYQIAYLAHGVRQTREGLEKAKFVNHASGSLRDINDIVRANKILFLLVFLYRVKIYDLK